MYFTWNNLQPQLLEKGITKLCVKTLTLPRLYLYRLDKISRMRNSRPMRCIKPWLTSQATKTRMAFASMITGIHFQFAIINGIRHRNYQPVAIGFARVKSSVEDGHAEIIQHANLNNDLRSAVQKQDAVLVMIGQIVTANIELEANSHRKINELRLIKTLDSNVFTCIWKEYMKQHDSSFSGFSMVSMAVTRTLPPFYNSSRFFLVPAWKAIASRTYQDLQSRMHCYIFQITSDAITTQTQALSFR